VLTWCCADVVQVIYIAPLKALVRERMNDWGKGMCKALGKKLVELTGGQGGPAADCVISVWGWALGAGRWALGAG
jgi:hypothetical protein